MTFAGEVAGTLAGTRVEVQVYRDGRYRRLDVELGRLDSGAGDGGGETELNGEPLGLSVRTLTDEISRQLGFEINPGGVVVTAVEPLGPASRAGLRPREVILRVQGVEIESADQFGRGGAQARSRQGRSTDRAQWQRRTLRNPQEEVLSRRSTRPSRGNWRMARPIPNIVVEVVLGLLVSGRRSPRRQQARRAGARCRRSRKASTCDGSTSRPSSPSPVCRFMALASEDFELRVNGEIHPVEDFSEVREAVSSDIWSRTGARRPRIRGWQSRRHRGLPTIRSSSTTTSRPSGTDRDEVIEALRGELSQLRPQDRMAIVAYDGHGIEMLSTCWTHSVAELEGGLDRACRSDRRTDCSVGPRRAYTLEARLLEPLRYRRSACRRPRGGSGRRNSSMPGLSQDQSEPNGGRPRQHCAASPPPRPAGCDSARAAVRTTSRPRHQRRRTGHDRAGRWHRANWRDSHDRAGLTGFTLCRGSPRLQSSLDSASSCLDRTLCRLGHLRSRCASFRHTPALSAPDRRHGLAAHIEVRNELGVAQRSRTPKR